MLARTHVIFGAFCWAALSRQLQYPIDALGVGCAMVGALLPDLDHPKSAFGSKVPFVSIPISMVFGHRGITHSAIAILACFVIAAADHQQSSISMPLIVGYISHLLGDAVTSGGIPMFWPSKTRYGIPLWKTGSIVEYLAFIGLTLGFLMLLVRTI